MEIVATVLIIAVQLMAPLAWAVYGEIIAERSGVLNVGLEGAVLLGAWGTAVGYTRTGDPWIGVLLGVGVGLVTGAVLAFLYVWRRVDQIVGGIIVILLAGGITVTFWVTLQGDAPTTNLERMLVPLLSEIPVIGPALFGQNALVLGAVIAGPVLLLLLTRTRWGIRLRAAGEAPEALDASGISVRRVRTVGIVLGTTLGAVGGATLVLTSSSGAFVANMSAGIGFIALAVVILARWNPLVGLAAALVFGILQALQYQAQSLPFLAGVPTQLILALPYIASIVVVAFNRAARYPAATGVAWEPRS
ncbi:ABC transporter permease [Herbiconiux sp. VKM Ac-2851]|uniref:ABC transporter permease n=1 Tax=Herbiconiux sp. VKM Ac-2851 TaxID=2739025 RepID=UPI0015665E15|nr:ABC transporter permease [Herbiconiux sp. VKM Ac-2851]NQX35107.1 ABC transporter permease [Herbiconiux sp. VKM Ac-2851]